MSNQSQPDDPERFRKPAPVIALTSDVITGLNKLLDDAQKHASINGLPWRRGASGGKPLLYGGSEGRGACLAYGTIGSWNEIDLAVAAVNALPALLASHAALVALDCSDILGVAESCASGLPRWDHVSKKINTARAVIAKGL